MLTFRMLGGAALENEQKTSFEALLRQPKHLALFAYLAMPRPGHWHRRDSILAVFWAEHEQGKARSALRSALYTLRRHLPEGVLITRGDEEVSVDASQVLTDVAQMAAAADAADFETALSMYRGELLPGLFVPDASDFDNWLGSERQRVRLLAARSASELVRLRAASGDLRGAVEAARQESKSLPDDETAVRRLIALLDRSGDRAGAFAVYQRFRDDLNESLGIRPSAETVALMDSIRSRHEAAVVPHDVPELARAHVDDISAAPTPASDVPAVRRRRVPRSLLITLAVAAASLLVWSFSFRGSDLDQRDAESTSRVSNARGARALTTSLVILPVQNRTATSELDSLAADMRTKVARHLDGAGGLRVSLDPSSSREEGRRVFLHTTLRALGDSLELTGQLVDSSRADTRPVDRVRFVRGGNAEVESKLAASIYAALFLRPVPPPGAFAGQETNPASYRAMLEGFQLLRDVQGEGPAGKTKAKFDEALRLDRNNARAWAGLSSVYMIAGNSGNAPIDEAFRKVVDAAENALSRDPLQGAALANMAFGRARMTRELRPNLALIDSAIRLEPSNAEIWQVKGALLRIAGYYADARHAYRTAKELEPSGSYFSMYEASSWFCEGRPREALDVFADELRTPSPSLAALRTARRSYAMMGRFDSALVMWTQLATLTRDTAALTWLREAHGRAGYYRVRHREGQRLSAQAAQAPMVRQMYAAFYAGDSTRAYRLLSELQRQAPEHLHNLACNENVDEFRDARQVRSAKRPAGVLP
ncbi:MAG: hypothetical protein IT353_19975 [Gemmatimonadaceae bacterium]|nr:hypothetical protein [Gemmatimonadaceae bacterium]